MLRQIKLASLVLAAAATSAVSSDALAVPTIYNFAAPAGWPAGAAGTTYQEWAANSSDSISGVPNVGSNTAGVTLSPSTLTVNSPGFVAGSGGGYSFSAPYTVTAAVKNHTTLAAAGVGTHVVVQALSTQGTGLAPHSITDINLVTSTGAAIAGTVELQAAYYGYAEGYPTSIGNVPVEAAIYEFWLPDYVGDFSAVVSNVVHSSFQQLRVDTAVAPATGGATPFSLTAVPEPASIAAAGLVAIGLLTRRRAR